MLYHVHVFSDYNTRIKHQKHFVKKMIRKDDTYLGSILEVKNFLDKVNADIQRLNSIHKRSSKLWLEIGEEDSFARWNNVNRVNRYLEPLITIVIIKPNINGKENWIPSVQ